MSLSDKRELNIIEVIDKDRWIYTEENVKEAVKKLREEFRNMNHHAYTWDERDVHVNIILEEIFGDKLCGDGK